MNVPAVEVYKLNTLLAYLEQFIIISENDWGVIAPRLGYESYEKGEELTSLGEVERNLFFLLAGALRLYREQENKDITLNIDFPNSFISSYSSYLTQLP